MGDKLGDVNYFLPMVRKVDPADLIDAKSVAQILGLSHPAAVSVYRKRYGSSFPQPVVDMGKGRCLLWLRHDVERWRTGRGK